MVHQQAPGVGFLWGGASSLSPFFPHCTLEQWF